MSVVEATLQTTWHEWLSIANIGRLLRAAVASPRTPDSSKAERQPIPSLEPSPHHAALRRGLVRFGERHRRHDATVLTIKPGAPLAVLQRPEVVPQLAPGLYLGSPKASVQVVPMN